MLYHEIRVARVVAETPEARSYVLEVPPALGERFAYRPGQFLTFRVPLPAGPLLRCYSLSSAPETDPAPQVTVKRIADGRVSGWFHERVREGDVLEVAPPAGRFVLPESGVGGGRSLLLFGGGSGITPLLSLVKSALARGGAERLRLVYANRDAGSVIFRAALDGLARAHPGRLEVVHHLDAERGFLDAAGAAAFLEGFEEAEVYLCGPPPFMETVEGTLRARGVPEARIHVERFSSPPDGEAPAPVAAADEVGAVPETLAIRLDGADHRVPYREGWSILRAAREAGLEPPFACEEGYCGSCAARCRKGRVAMESNDVFSEAEVAAGAVLTCQGRPRGPICEIDYDDAP